ncbi:hypothetical protein KIN20_036280 [Parelaphostrongylus tenuis]|uniref:Uncharacterized protein n=1 Tax=Parelaphostrongylus tenuis TaxID=148309 RepID=A0AAD5WKA5_PARTN|nr:hypothetical protein KIN20_036280 [Parelaphostrongylus tenuis]
MSDGSKGLLPCELACIATGSVDFRVISKESNKITSWDCSELAASVYIIQTFNHCAFYLITGYDRYDPKNAELRANLKTSNMLRSGAAKIE